MFHQTTKFMMNNGARLSIKTREEALARQREQLASAVEEDKQSENPGWFIELSRSAII